MILETLQSPPKSLVIKTVKFSEEQIQAIDELRHMHGKPKSFSEWVKDACNSQLEQVYGHRLGFPNIYTFAKYFEAKLGNTFEVNVIPKR